MKLDAIGVYYALSKLAGSSRNASVSPPGGKCAGLRKLTDENAMKAQKKIEQLG